MEPNARVGVRTEWNQTQGWVYGPCGSVSIPVSIAVYLSPALFRCIIKLLRKENISYLIYLYVFMKHRNRNQIWRQTIGRYRLLDLLICLLVVYHVFCPVEVYDALVTSLLPEHTMLKPWHAL